MADALVKIAPDLFSGSVSQHQTLIPTVKMPVAAK
jgi:hypothetical protein